MGITETWFKDSTSDAQVALKNYVCIRSDRDSRRGGGCALYLHCCVVPTDQLTADDTYNNLAAVYIDSLHTVIAVVYRPPDSPDADFAITLDKLQDFIDGHSFEERCPELYLMGDFNLPLFDWDQCAAPPNPPNAAYCRLLAMIEVNFLTQMVSQPTRANNTLDLVLTNAPQNIIEVDVEPTKLSDHEVVSCLLSFNPSIRNVIPTCPHDPFSFRAVNFHKADMDALNRELGEIDWYSLKEICDDSNDQDGSLFKELIVLTVLQCTILHAPPNVRPSGAVKCKMERELISLKMKRRKLNRKLRNLRFSNPSSSRIPLLEASASLAAYEIKDVIVNHLNQRETNAVSTIKSNPKYFYSYAKRLAKSKSTVAPLKNIHGALTDDPKEKAEILQAQYISVFSDPAKVDLEACKRYTSPVKSTELEDMQFTVEDITAAISELDPYSATPDGDIPAKILCGCRNSLATPIWLLWKSSFDSGTIAPDLKLQYITPIHKKGNKTEAVNYRPVSLTSHLIKIFERVMRNHLVQYLEENSLLPDNQHGFRKNRSCLTQLIEHIDAVLKSLNDGNEVDVIYLDYSKAFDKVDHQILLAKLKMYGVTGKVYRWIESFLTNRKQAVVVDSKKTTFRDVKSGVPQSTVLGPVFFILYVIDMILEAKNSKALTFADDTKLMKIIVELLCSTLLQADLHSVTQWSIANNMLLHEDKFVVMNYCLNASKTLRELPFTIEGRQYSTTDGKIMELSSVVRDLGVYLSDDCSWTYHINKMTSDARKIASWVLGAFRDRSILTMTTLFKSLVRSKLEYCCPLWNPARVTDIQTIENVQKQFTKKICGISQLDYWERLKRLKLLSLQRRRERYSIIHVWKLANGKAPNNIGMSFYSTPRLGIRAVIPTFNHRAQRSISTAYDNSFGIRAARLWNTLPKDVNSLTTLESFKIALSDFIRQFPDKPPVTGYTPPNNNSILDWCASGGDGVGVQH